MGLSFNYCGRFSVLDFYPGMDVCTFFVVLRKYTEQNILLQKQDYYDLKKVLVSLSQAGFDCSVEDDLLVIKIPAYYKYFQQVNMAVYVYYDAHKGFLSYIKLSQISYSQKSTAALYNTILFVFEHRIKTFDSLFKWDEDKADMFYFATNAYYNVMITSDTSKAPLEIVVLLGINDINQISNKNYFCLIEKLDFLQRDKRILELKLVKYDKTFKILGLHKHIMNKIDRKLKCFMLIGLGAFCFGLLMLGFSIGRFSFPSVKTETFKTESTIGAKVFVSDSPGSKRYHKDRNCQALKRSTGNITATDENDAICQGKTLCGWCGK